MRVANLLDFCNQPGANKLEYLPVLNLKMINFETSEAEGHAVAISDYFRHEDSLVLTVIDSLSDDGVTSIKCPIKIINGREKLVIDGEDGQWCLRSDKCYVFYFN